jgi:hypothetical protein
MRGEYATHLNKTLFLSQADVPQGRDRKLHVCGQLSAVGKNVGAHDSF